MRILTKQRVYTVSRWAQTLLIVSALLLSMVSFVIATRMIAKARDEASKPRQEITVCFATQNIYAGSWVNPNEVVTCFTYDRPLTLQEIQQVPSGQLATKIYPTTWEVNENGETMALVNIKSGEIVNGNMFTALPPVKEPFILASLTIPDYPGAGPYTILLPYNLEKEEGLPLSFMGYQGASSIVIRLTCYESLPQNDALYPTTCLAFVRDVTVYDQNHEVLAVVPANELTKYLGDLSAVSGMYLWVSDYPFVQPTKGVVPELPASGEMPTNAETPVPETPTSMETPTPVPETPTSMETPTPVLPAGAGTETPFSTPTIEATPSR